MVNVDFVKQSDSLSLKIEIDPQFWPWNPGRFEKTFTNSPSDVAKAATDSSFRTPNSMPRHDHKLGQADTAADSWIKLSLKT